MLNLLLILLLASRATVASAQTGSPQRTFCLSQIAGAPTANSTYLSNLGDLAATLADAASKSGFANGSAGTGADKVYGLALCRGDYTGARCSGGIKVAFQDAIDRACKDATFYYDQYMLRYTNDERALSNLTNAPEWNGTNMNYVTGLAGTNASARFMERTVELMDRMADFAAFNTSSRYATGEAGYGEHDASTVYGLVQCTPDLTGAQCRSCLSGIIAQMGNFSAAAGTWAGGRIQGVRCNLRYETDGRFFEETNTTLKLHLPKRETSTVIKIVIFGVPLLVLIILILILRPYIIKQVRELLLQRDLVILQKEIESESDSRFSLFGFSKIKYATNNFSEENKLGEGGFGPVYQGRLRNNQHIAVKRLSRNSVQGFREFKNEIKLIASLQHRNLVRLLGCCIKSKERILIYEYMPNGNLEEIIFGSEVKLGWQVRRRIVEGITEGLLYIHEYAHACIVHRDLKPSNILLDHDMTPKISDFGIARICLSNETESNTTTAMGTFGYIAPEYCYQKVYSTKSDVFSFGILVLEIISGKTAVGSYQLSGRSYELRRYAWQLWKEERCDEFVDQSLGQEYQEMDIIRCIQVALLCVQDSAEDRPSMHDVATMLSNKGRRLLVPAQPGSFIITIGDSGGDA